MLSDKTLLTMIRMRIQGCPPCRYGEPTSQCSDEVHKLLIQIRSITERSKEAGHHVMIEADLNEMYYGEGIEHGIH